MQCMVVFARMCDVPNARSKRAADGSAELPAAASKVAKRSRADEEPEYYFENVRPYWFTYKTYAKRRWLSKRLSDVFKSEFYWRPHNYVEAIKLGRFSLNGRAVSEDVVLRDNDYIEHVVHRHELPVAHCAIDVIADTAELLVVNKPSSMPVHACGRYHFNSVIQLLRRDHGYGDLRVAYRLDRPTSGVLVFAKTLATDQKLKREIMRRESRKEYVCKVDGRFPAECSCEQPLGPLSHSMGVQRVAADGKAASTRFELVATDGDTSIVRCLPLTGRTHQIRVHLQYLGHPIVNDSIYNSLAFGPTKGKSGEYGKSIEQLAADIEREHERVWSDTGRPPPESPDAHYDAHCCDCRSPFKEPSLESLQLYLHCHNYEFADYAFTAPLPSWATLDESASAAV